MPHGVEIHRLI